MRPQCAHVLLWAVAGVLSTSTGAARSYYVSTTGSDANLGTLDSPFQTIQRAANVAAAGDTVFVRAGVYREVIGPARSGTQSAPITFQPYSNENVTISGADVIPTSSWSLSSGNIYKAAMSWDLGEGNNQIFLDGQMMIEARWPNTTLDVSHPVVALTGDGSWVDGGPSPALSTGSITGLNLPSRSTDYWSGTTIHIGMFRADYHQGAGWSWQTGSVVNSTANQLAFTFQKYPDVVENMIRPGPKNPYYLTGKGSELDAAGEWFRDGVTSTLNFWTPAGDSPARHLVEAKRRQYAFNLAGRSFVTIQGFNLFAASIFSDAQSQYLVLDGLNVQYVSHQSLIPNPGLAFVGVSNSGIFLDGKNNVLRNSSIAFSSGNGVQVAGTSHRVFNNVIHDTDYAATEASPIAAGYNTLTTGFLIAWNTVYNTAKHGILHTNRTPNTGNGRILHNEIYNYGIQTTDLGCIYTYGSNGNGTEIAHNVCHHESSANLGTGIYLDFDSSNYVAHHNLVWNAYSSARMNSVSRNNRIYNNTFAAGTNVGLIVTPGHDGTAQFPGSEVKNNIFTAALNGLVNNSGAVLQNNILTGTDPQFVDPARNNYQLKTTSPAIDGGLTIAPYTDGFLGRAPDIGAFESGLPAWKAGAGQAIASPLSAASYGTALAPDSIAVVFGPKLATGSADTPSATLPTSLAGTSVTIIDGVGVDRVVPLFYVRPTQLAFHVPAATAPGIALITVTASDGTISVGSAPFFPTAPGLISANSSGTGVAAANLVRVKADGTQVVEAVATFDSGQGQFVPLAIDRGSATDVLVLVLYGTGIRNHGPGSSAVIAQVGGNNVQVDYAGAQNVFPGLDQVNIRLPRNLPVGTSNIALTVDGIPANTVTIAMR